MPCDPNFLAKIKMFDLLDEVDKTDRIYENLMAKFEKLEKSRAS